MGYIKSVKEFYGDSFFDWEFSTEDQFAYWDNRKYNPDKWWGRFDESLKDITDYKYPDYSIGNFTKHPSPVLSPESGKWDCGRFGGGVHNGSVIIKDDKFYYIYRGEFPISKEYQCLQDVDYQCDIGVAVSSDGINFDKRYDVSPFFRKDGDEKYSFEDVNVVEYNSMYYMFVNRWSWKEIADADENGVYQGGVYIATSKDLLHWEKVGLAFPGAKKIHRNACVLQDPHNRAVKVNGKFVMYLNYGLIAFSDDLLHWTSVETETKWPGGENCFALANYDKSAPDNVLVFTGGHHTGHFYAIGEVLFNKNNLLKPVDWLKRPVLHCESQYPHENGYSYEPRPRPVSYWRDTVFFTGMTLHKGKWWLYYGGSEYYTCLAVSKDHTEEY